jgi:BCCT family betaine/carnitine transporter
MNTSAPDPNRAEPSNDWSIFGPALMLVVLIGASMIAWPEAGAELASTAMNFVTAKLGWLYMTTGITAFFFAGWLAFGPYGNVLLGEPGKAPEYSNVHWIAMMFTAGIGGSLIAWGIAEPIFYVQTPPFGIAAHSDTALEWAHMVPLFHWGVTPWAFYAIPTVPIAYMLFVNRTPMLKISGACEGVLPVRGRKTISTVIDIVIALGIVGGTATSLGVGVPLVSAMVSELLGIADLMTTKFVVLAVWLLLFGASAYRGLKKGIKVLADINMILVGIALLFILFAGPTLFILSITVNSVGLLADNFVRMSTWLDPISQ